MSSYLEKIFADPANDEARIVYATTLAEDNPHREFIFLQLEPDPVAADVERMNELLTKYSQEWVGPLSGLLRDYGQVFERGFLVECILKTEHELYKRLANSPYWRTVKRLDFREINLANLKPLANLTELQELHIGGARESVNLDHLSKLSKLTLLSLFNSMASDFSPLKKLTKLDQLVLDGTSVTDISFVSSLENLRHLSISRTNVTDLAALSNLHRLESLDIWATQVSDLSPIAGLPINDLVLNQTPVNDFRTLADLPLLIELTVCETSFRDLSPLSGLQHLREILIPDTVPLAACEAFVAQRPYLVLDRDNGESPLQGELLKNH